MSKTAKKCKVAGGSRQGVLSTCVRDQTTGSTSLSPGNESDSAPARQGLDDAPRKRPREEEAHGTEAIPLTGSPTVVSKAAAPPSESEESDTETEGDTETDNNEIEAEDVHDSPLSRKQLAAAFKAKLAAASKKTKPRPKKLSPSTADRPIRAPSQSTRKASVSKRSVEKVCLETGDTLDCYDSISGAARAVGAAQSGISLCLNGSSKSCMGFFWRYAGSKESPPPRKVRQPVEKVCLETGQTLRRFDTAAEAARAVGASIQAIRKCLHGKSEEAEGFFWRYEGSDAFPKSTLK